jgi:ribosomal-protein-alanine N-acetyltransferase
MTLPIAPGHPTVSLQLLPAPALAAMLEGDLARASAVTGVDLPPFFLTQDWLWRFRLNQIETKPASAPWLVRAVIALPDGVVVGHAGFHGPPDDKGMVEIGYSVLPEFRRQGYGRAAARELIRYAKEQPDVRVVRASISPDNVASLALIRTLGFTHVGEQWDEEDGLELVFELPLQNG